MASSEFIWKPVETPAESGDRPQQTSGSEADALERLKRLNESAAEAARTAPDQIAGSPKFVPAVIRTGSPGGAVDAAQAEKPVSEAEALKRLSRLNEALRNQPQVDHPRLEPEMDDVVVNERRFNWIRNRLPSKRIIKSLLALAAVVALAWVPIRTLLTTTSTQATINARLMNFRTPINGKVSILAPRLNAGSLIQQGEPLFRVTNARADRQRLDDLRREISLIRTETVTLENKIGQLQDIEKGLKAQTDAFQSSRVRQLEARQNELEAEVKAAVAAEEDALKSLERSQELQSRGHQTVATLLHAERDHKVAIEKTKAARRRLEGNKIELEGAQKGFFVGDSYNDLPRSAQRLDEIGQQLVSAKSEQQERKARLEFLEKELASEAELFTRDSTAEIVSPVRGRVWQVLTANGEEVSSGQDLLKVVDCSAAVVTATVSETVYNRLWIGQAVEFQLRGQSKVYSGKVAGLTGLAPAGSNFAIEQVNLRQEPHHVTVSVPALQNQKSCNIGRTGNVTFLNSAAEAPKLLTPASRGMETVGFAHGAASVANRVTASVSALAGAAGKVLAGQGGK
jgi:multidrug resistance efflux pump